jgi:hypothetical protein
MSKSNANKSHRPGEGSTGPTSPEGKQRSSRNATSHGARSQQHVILPNESAADFEKLRSLWYEEFCPYNDLDRQFLDRLAELQWQSHRCDRLHNEAFMKALLNNPDPETWSPEQHKHLQLMNRYRVAADRAWRAAWKDIETLRKNRLLAAARAESLKRLAFHNCRDGINPPEPDSSEEPTNVEAELIPELEALDPEHPAIRPHK